MPITTSFAKVNLQKHFKILFAPFVDWIKKIETKLFFFKKMLWANFVFIAQMWEFLTKFAFKNIGLRTPIFPQYWVGYPIPPNTQYFWPTQYSTLPPAYLVCLYQLRLRWLGHLFGVNYIAEIYKIWRHPGNDRQRQCQRISLGFPKNYGGRCRKTKHNFKALNPFWSDW